MISKIKTINLDSIGFSASFICAVHCATLPLILTWISASNFSFLANPTFEIFMISISIIVGMSSLLPNYKKHKRFLPIFILLFGFFLIFSGHFLVSSKFESIITPIGAFVVAISHLSNWRINKHNCDDLENIQESILDV